MKWLFTARSFVMYSLYCETFSFVINVIYCLRKIYTLKLSWSNVSISVVSDCSDYQWKAFECFQVWGIFSLSKTEKTSWIRKNLFRPGGQQHNRGMRREWIGHRSDNRHENRSRPTGASWELNWTSEFMTEVIWFVFDAVTVKHEH